MERRLKLYLWPLPGVRQGVCGAQTYSLDEAVALIREHPLYQEHALLIESVLDGSPIISEEEEVAFIGEPGM